MKCFINFVAIMIFVSIISTCKSTSPSNPYDPGYDLPEPSNFNVEQTGITSITFSLSQINALC